MNTLVFFGSDRFSSVVLSELITQKHTPSLVVTDPPKPIGRKQLITPNKVEMLANEQNIKVLYYPSKNNDLDNFIKLITDHCPLSTCVGLSASFPHIFPPEFIKLFKNNLFNLHPSLLPQYRNVAPGPYAIAMGDAETAVTLQHIDEKVDHGSIVAQAVEPIHPTDTTPTLLTRLFTLGTKMFINHLRLSGSPIIRQSEFSNCPNPIFTRRLTRESGYLEWDVVQKLLQGQALKVGDTKNPLVNLRLTHHPDRTSNILPDLIRALDGYEKVWTTAPTKRGELPISLSLAEIRNTKYEIQILIPGKPRSIPYSDFEKYYL